MRFRSTTKRGLAILFAVVIAGTVAFTATWPRFHQASVTSLAGSGGAASPAGGSTVTASSSAASVASSGPPLLTTLPLPIPLLEPHADSHDWARLSADQQAALAPFAPIWNSFSRARREKWLKIAATYKKLPPDAQKRLHEGMGAWAHMSHEQRRTARENYQVSTALPAQARERAWKAYQKLTDEQKRKLASSEKAHQATVVSAPPSGATEVRGLGSMTKRDAGAPIAPALPSPSLGNDPATSPGSPLAASAPSIHAPGVATTSTPSTVPQAATPKTIAPPPQRPASLFNDNAQ